MQYTATKSIHPSPSFLSISAPPPPQKKKLMWTCISNYMYMYIQYAVYVYADCVIWLHLLSNHQKDLQDEMSYIFTGT